MAWASDGALARGLTRNRDPVRQFFDGHVTAVHAGLDSALAVASATGAAAPRWSLVDATEAEPTCWEGMRAARVGSR